MKFAARVLTGAALAALSFGLAPPGMPGALQAAHAQNLGQRNVTGSVIAEDSTAVPGATVFLRDTKNKSIRSYTSTKDGHFRFAQVNMSEDYDIWAEKDGKKSPTKTVSAWDNRKEFVCELKLK